MTRWVGGVRPTCVHLYGWPQPIQILKNHRTGACAVWTFVWRYMVPESLLFIDSGLIWNELAFPPTGTLCVKPAWPALWCCSYTWSDLFSDMQHEQLYSGIGNHWTKTMVRAILDAYYIVKASACHECCRLLDVKVALQWCWPTVTHSKHHRTVGGAWLVQSKISSCASVQVWGDTGGVRSQRFWKKRKTQSLNRSSNPCLPHI